MCVTDLSIWLPDQNKQVAKPEQSEQATTSTIAVYNSTLHTNTIVINATQDPKPRSVNNRYNRCLPTLRHLQPSMERIDLYDTTVNYIAPQP